MLLTKRQLISTAAAAGSATLLGPIRGARAADKISVAVIPIADCALDLSRQGQGLLR